MWQYRDTILKVIEEINYNYQTAKKANENVTDSLRKITKEILWHSFEIEKSEITSAPEETGNAIRASFILLRNKRKSQKMTRKLKDSLEKKKIEEASLWNEWNMIRDKLRSFDAEKLFEVIKIKRQYGFRSVSRYISEN